MYSIKVLTQKHHTSLLLKKVIPRYKYTVLGRNTSHLKKKDLKSSSKYTGDSNKSHLYLKELEIKYIADILKSASYFNLR